ncbi:MAG: hypothetical protein ACOY3D_07615 [Candidatus Omnitrophota bacterium]
MDKDRGKNSRRRKYSKPKIIYSKDIEVLAVTCPSGYSGLGSCRTDGVCSIAWE